MQVTHRISHALKRANYQTNFSICSPVLNSEFELLTLWPIAKKNIYSGKRLYQYEDDFIYVKLHVSNSIDTHINVYEVKRSCQFLIRKKLVNMFKT